MYDRMGERANATGDGMTADPPPTWRYTDPREFLGRLRGGVEELPPLIVTVAITGGVQGKESHAGLPETPEEQAQSTREAWNVARASFTYMPAGPRTRA